MSATVREARMIEQPGARNASPRTPQLSPPGHAPQRHPSEAPLHAPAPAAVSASPRPPLAPWVRASPAPAPRQRFERPCGARNASPRTLWRPMPGHAPPHRPAKAPPCASASAAVDASPRPPLAPWVRASPPPLRASVSSVQRTQETRLAAPPRSLPRSQPPAPALRGSEGSRSRSLNLRGGRWPRPPLVSLPTFGSL